MIPVLSEVSGPVQQPRLSAGICWTLTGNTMYAGCQWAIIAVIAKLGSPEMVGQFALALAILAPLMMFTNLQLRVIQATDVAADFLIGDFLGLRALTTAAAVLTSLGILLLDRLRGPAAAVLLWIAIAKSAESFSDILYGLFQRHEHLDIMGRSLILKGLVSLALLSAVMYVTHSTAMAAAALAISWLAVFALYDLPHGRAVLSRAQITAGLLPCWRPGKLRALMAIGLPMGLVMALTSVTVSIPRYFLQHSSGAAGLGIFAAVAYISIAGTTIVNAVGQATVSRLAVHYAKNRRLFVKWLAGLILTGLAVGAAGVLMAFGAGREILTILYNAEYGKYADVMVLVMVAGALTYIASFLGYGMTAARQFPEQVPVVVASCAVTASACVWLVPRWSLKGAAIALILGAAVQTCGSALVLAAALRRSPSAERI
jgi:O-antigen/teichoic acid export membrane protein